MPDTAIPRLGGAAETLLIPLYFRAAESCRPDALLRDDKAVDLVERIDYDFGHQKRQASEQALVVVMRVRQFDRYVAAFLAAHPQATVVDLGCGLDTRFFRLDDGRVQWYDLDLPEVIDLRRQLLGESPRCRFLGCSVLDHAWMDVVDAVPGRHLLFLSEGVFCYLEPAGVKHLVRTLADRFPGSQLVFDGVPHFLEWAYRLHPVLRGTQARVLWGMKHGRELEAWDPRLRLLEEWHYYDQPEPRLGLYRLLRWLPPFGKGFRIVRYRLGHGDGTAGGTNP